MENLPERPSFIYITEISHLYKNEAYVFGGGFWAGAELEGNMGMALVGKTPEECINNELLNIRKENVIIDYHGFVESQNKCKIGDSVIYGFYSQIQMTRSYITVASGVQHGNIKVEGIFDHAGNLLDNDWCPVNINNVKMKIKEILKKYD